MKLSLPDKRTESIKEINRLWENVYPFLADVIIEEYGKYNGRVLEIGPFSGGITVELAKLCPQMEFSIFTWGSETKHCIEENINKAGLKERVNILSSPDKTLDFADNSFDLVISRGALFFLDSTFLKAIFRIIRTGGLGYIGGGYGKKTPNALIDEIHDASHRLNQELGKRWITKSNLEDLLEDTLLTSYCRIEEKGGLWLIASKQKRESYLGL